MNETQRTEFAERLKTAAEARSALLAKLRPKPTVIAAQAPDRTAARAAELEQVRAARRQAKADKQQAAADAQEAARQAGEAAAAASLDAKRGERKERKALTEPAQKAKRDQRNPARKARP